MTWMEILLVVQVWVLGAAIYWVWLRSVSIEEWRSGQRIYQGVQDNTADRLDRLEKRLPPDEVTAVDSVRTAHARVHGLERRVHGAERLAAEAKGKADSVDRRVRQMGGQY